MSSGVVSPYEDKFTPDAVLSEIIGNGYVCRLQAIYKFYAYINKIRETHKLNTFEEIRQKDNKLKALIPDNELREYIIENNKHQVNEENHRNINNLEFQQRHVLHFLAKHLKFSD